MQLTHHIFHNCQRLEYKNSDGESDADQHHNVTFSPQVPKNDESRFCLLLLNCFSSVTWFQSMIHGSFPYSFWVTASSIVSRSRAWAIVQPNSKHSNGQNTFPIPWLLMALPPLRCRVLTLPSFRRPHHPSQRPPKPGWDSKH